MVESVIVVKEDVFETYASASGIKRTVFKLLATNKVETPLRNYTYESLSAKKITEMAFEGDPIALKLTNTHQIF